MKGVEVYWAPLAADLVVEQERLQVEQRVVDKKPERPDVLPPGIGGLPVAAGRGGGGAWSLSNEMVLRGKVKAEMAGIPAKLTARGLKPGTWEWRTAFNYAQGMAAERALRAMDPDAYAGSRRDSVTLPDGREVKREHDVLSPGKKEADRSWECKTGPRKLTPKIQDQIDGDVAWKHADLELPGKKGWHSFRMRPVRSVLIRCCGRS